MKKLFGFVLVIMVLLPLLASCGETVTIVVTATPEKAHKKATATRVPTKAPTKPPKSTPTTVALDDSVDTPASAEPESTPTPPKTTKQVAYQNVTFSFPLALATGVSAETVPAQSGPGMPPWEVAPEHLRFEFTKYSLAGEHPNALIYVFPADEYAALIPDDVGPVVDTVKSLTSRRLDLPTVYPPYSAVGSPQQSDGRYETYRRHFPVVPPANAAPLMKLKMDYLDFNKGSGIKYVTEFVQNLVPIDGNLLRYSFQGITDDGKYYVAAWFPVRLEVSTEGVPGASATDDEINAYNADLTKRLNALPNDEFSPSLNNLDALIQSILVK